MTKLKNEKMKSVLQTIDPTTFEIISHRLHQVTVEMGTTLERVGGTANITQMRDYMTALYRADGAILSSGQTLGFYVPCAGYAVQEIIKRFGADGGIGVDDMYLLNEPYVAAIHQSDVFMISPIHYRGRLVAWSATFVHVMDIGAMSPGGNSPGAKEIFQEGVRTPGLRLVEGGKLRRDVFDMILNMTRQPVMVGLDLKCEIAANNVAKARMQGIFDQYGVELVDAVSSELIHYTERVLKGRLSEIPDGEWCADGEIRANRSWKIAARLEKRGEKLKFDFTGSDEQATLGINLPYHATFGACYDVLVSTLGYDLPKNQGAVGLIDIVAPGGTVVNVRYPGPVSLNTTSGVVSVRQVVNSVVMQMAATSARWRGEVMAVMAGHRAMRQAGVNQYGRYYVSAWLELSGNGASAGRDGIDSSGALLSSTITCYNAEWAELNFPVLYLFRRHIKDGAGAGKYRGGAGVEAAFTLHEAPEGKIKGIAFGVAGLRNSGRGMFGGYSAAPSILIHVKDSRVKKMLADGRAPEDLDDLGGEKIHVGYCEVEVKSGDVAYIRHASGGGYGDPLERDPQSVREDVVNELVSREAARAVYGVAVSGEGVALDRDSTAALRERYRQERIEGSL